MKPQHVTQEDVNIRDTAELCAIKTILIQAGITTEEEIERETLFYIHAIDQEREELDRM